jgi:hypothetical protein
MIRIKQGLLVVVGFLFLSVSAAAVFFPAVASAQPAEVEVCQSGDACNTFIDKYIEPFVTLLTVSIGIIAAISVVVAGIQFASAADDPGKVAKAKERMWKTVIGLVAYIFLFAFLNYLVPGGII